MDMSKYKEMFLSETGEHLDTMSRLLVALEQDPSDREGIDALFRSAHSVKGMAAAMGFRHTAELAHHLEDLMDGFRKSGTVPPEAVDRLLAGTDLLAELLEDLAADRPEREVRGFLEGTTESPEETPPAPAAAAEPETEADTPAGTMLQVIVTLAEGAPASAARALLILRELGTLGTVCSSEPAADELTGGGDVARLSLWLRTERPREEVGELLKTMADVDRVDFGVDRRRRAAPAHREDGGRSVRVRTELLDRFIDLTGELITSRYALQTAAGPDAPGPVHEGLKQLTRLIDDLHHQVLQVRMMPLESVTGRLPRLVRDLCRTTGKEVRLRVEGGEVELDRAILEELSDPLVHMVRNAVDHGIDTSGEVTVSARREKDMVLLQVADDGRGMDPAAIRRKAVERGLLGEEQAQGLRDRDVLQLVCRPGFSTAPQVTETSGRGVGMDVVKSSVENLGGTLEIDSTPGAGSRIVLRLPLSVAIVRVLLVECCGHTVAIPLTRVLRTLAAERGELRRSGRQLSVRMHEATVPLLSLHRILRLPSRPRTGPVPVVVSEVRGRPVGLVVDRLVGQREVFVKPLAAPLDALAGVGGATVLGDGSVVFIIDPQSLLEGQAAAAQGDAP